MIADMSIRYKDYEFKTVDAYLTRGWGLETVELRKWDEDHCFTLLYWQKAKDGFDITFVGERVFNEIPEEDIIEIWRIMSLIQKYLDGLIE